jgi:ribonuclease T1
MSAESGVNHHPWHHLNLVALVLVTICLVSCALSPPATLPVVILINIDDLPPEAIDTLELIEKGGPFPIPKTGPSSITTKGYCPQKQTGIPRIHGYNPGESDRGARRIVTGADGERYYTDDHYKLL